MWMDDYPSWSFNSMSPSHVSVTLHQQSSMTHAIDPMLSIMCCNNIYISTSCAVSHNQHSTVRQTKINWINWNQRRQKQLISLWNSWVKSVFLTKKDFKTKGRSISHGVTRAKSNNNSHAFLLHGNTESCTDPTWGLPQGWYLTSGSSTCRCND